MAQMKSLYDGKCATCGKNIKAGEQIDYRGKGNTHHAGCVFPFIVWDEHDANALADKLGFSKVISYAKSKSRLSRR